MIPYWEVHGWSKYVEQDDHEHGCDPSTGHEYTGSEFWQAGTLDALIRELRAFVPFTTDDPDAIVIDAGEEPGRIDICGMEDDDGTEPTTDQMRRWIGGAERLYYVVYTFHVERVIHETRALTPLLPPKETHV